MDSTPVNVHKIRRQLGRYSVIAPFNSFMLQKIHGLFTKLNIDRYQEFVIFPLKSILLYTPM